MNGPLPSVHVHARNRYRQPYDLALLARAVPELSAYIRTTPDGRPTVDFTQPAAVRHLNRALLLSDYQLAFYDLPPEALCPAVPSRLDYVHVVADLLQKSTRRAGRTVGLDIGTGASLIYPILGVREYGWRFVATDINETSLRAAKAIVSFNPGLRGKVEVRRQTSPQQIFAGVLQPGERYDFTMCNPPFYESEAAARKAAQRKWRKLGRRGTATFNFGGQGAELHTPGGEPRFLRAMIAASYRFRSQVEWFTTLVSQRAYLKVAEAGFRQNQPRNKEVIALLTGTKTRQVLAWRW